jgi:hypothetical protein
LPEDRDEDDGSDCPHGNDLGKVDIKNVGEIVAERLAPMAGTLSRLTQQVAAFVAGKNVGVTSEAAVSGATEGPQGYKDDG